MNPLYDIRLVMGIALLTSAVTAENFPYAKGTFVDNELRQWTPEKVHMYRDNVIGNLIGADSIMEKDNAAIPLLLGYLSPKKEGISDEQERKNGEKGISDPEAVTFKTVLDLTTVDGLVNFAIQVDDEATLTVKEKLAGDEPTGYSPITKTYKVNGTALWRVDRSYKEFTDPIPAGRKYDLKLNYRNTANLTEKYDGRFDYDGVNVFLMHQPELGGGKLIAVDSKNTLRKANPIQKLVMVKYGGDARQAKITASPHEPKEGYPKWSGTDLVNPQDGALDVKYDSKNSSAISCLFSPEGRPVEKHIELIEENKATVKIDLDYYNKKLKLMNDLLEKTPLPQNLWVEIGI